MSYYRITIIDWSKKNGKIISTRFAYGLASARSIVGIPLHYAKGVDAWFAYAGDLEYMVCKC